MKTLFESYELDSSSLTESKILIFSRTIRIPTGKTRLQSACTINGQPITLKKLNEISSSILTIVDAPTASVAFSKAESRMTIIDQGVDGDILASTREAAETYANAKEARKKIELEIQQSELFLPPSVLQSKNENKVNINEDETLSLLQHWVEELDEFEERMSQLQTQASNVVSTSPQSKANTELKDTASVHGAASALAFSKWIENNEASESVYSHLLDFREAMKSLDDQLEHAQAAHDTLASLTSLEPSVAIALEKTRNHLYDITSENIDGNIGNDPISKATEHTHELLNKLELILKECTDSIDGDNGLIDHLQHVRLSITISNEDLDIMISDWNALARKHNISPYNLPECHTSLRKELHGGTNAREKLPKALKLENAALKTFEDTCKSLTNEREKVCEHLSYGVSNIMPQLGMEGSELLVHLKKGVRDCTSPTAYSGDVIGVDMVDFLLADRNEGITPNTKMEKKKGQGKIEQIASSGEKARLLLAIETELPGSVGATCGNRHKELKSHASRSKNKTNLIAVLYDEIDAHVGGRAAVAVARLLSSQSQSGGQVISITHSASVAAVANQHILIERTPILDNQGEKKIQIKAQSVEGSTRIQELARMASGDMAPKEAEIFAEALLRDGILQRDSKYDQ